MTFNSGHGSGLNLCVVLSAPPVWHRAGDSPAVLLLVDDPQVLHVPGPHGQQHQEEDLRRPGSVYMATSTIDA